MTDAADGFDNLDALRLSPEQVAATKPLKPRRQRKTHVAGDFYLCPIEWADRAGAAIIGAKGLLVAFRLYRRWRLRKPEEETIVASNAVLGAGPSTREIKRRVLAKLQTAGLLEVVDQQKGRAPRVRIIE